MSVISFKDFNFKYEGLKKNTLKHINLEIKQGEKVLIAGPSGSGKSTLAHCINGLIPFCYKGTHSGEVKIKDFNPMASTIHDISAHVGTILQDQDGQFVGLSVAEDVAFAFENDNVDQSLMKKHVREALDAVNMQAFENYSPHNLSGGQKQQVSMAGILATATDILLFDEPLANLDPVSGHKAMAIIDEIHREYNKTILIIEHRIEDVLVKNIDRIIIFNNGEIVANDTPGNILSSNLLAENGLREPIYVEAIKKTGIMLKPDDHIEAIDNSMKYKANVVDLIKTGSNRFIPDAKENLLSLEHISYKYHDNDRIVLKDISFEINKGEILSILGNNGAGKSTIFKVICGIAKGYKGNVYYKGQSINDWSIKKRCEKIGYVMQNPNHMIVKHTIFDEIAFGLRNKKETEETIEKKVFNVLKICGLYQYRNWPVSALSYGQKKRVTIASILVMEPEIIVLDEPTAGQDYKNYREFMSFIMKLKDMGISIVMITHDMTLALEYSDRGIVLSEGKIIADDLVSHILSDEQVMNQANLKETSLSYIGRLFDVPDVELFVDSYMNLLRGGERYE